MSVASVQYEVRLDEALSACIAGREGEIERLADTAREGELITVSAADPVLAAALADAAAILERSLRTSAAHGRPPRRRDLPGAARPRTRLRDSPRRTRPLANRRPDARHLAAR